MKKITKFFSSAKVALVAVVGVVGTLLTSVKASFAAPSSTPAEVLSNIVDTGINESLSLVDVVMTTYWGYIIVFFIIVGLLGLAKKFGKLGSH